jgi:hypothetical protein
MLFWFPDRLLPFRFALSQICALSQFLRWVPSLELASHASPGVRWICQPRRDCCNGRLPC